MEVPSTVSEYLDANINEANEFQEEWTQMKDFHSKALWHQLTLKLDSCTKKPEFRSKTDLIKFYYCNLEPSKGIVFLEEIRDKFTMKSKEAGILCNITIGMIYLTVVNNLTSARQMIETTQLQLNELNGVSTVHSRFYQLSSRYYQMTGQHAQFYQEALRFLGCVDMSTLSLQEQRGWAFSIGLAAILGERVYNFGELLTNEILNSLRDSPDSWLIDLLIAFSRGDLKQLDALRPRWSVQADLVAAESRLKDKVTLLCLVEMIFRRPTNKRCLKFADISKATRVPIDQIEIFLMRALSLNLIKGRIDEVDQSVSLTWLQPRVLDREQIGSMCVRLKEWCDSVSGMKDLVEIDTKSILT